ncbi:MAG: RidA family protein [Candidatus Krumholzibacteria bacterium]|jgi:2-iminobutanoate/2-iminopropanoate deaminase|nr:RidA family protein [Candidatus Krumholzibacteria bacterium]MDP6669914.1 RidA family protein [Candidatus Krumholzibacteria bacterium]MDP6796986.1 RidA family protein [Candidatus Krumholzibacteria bacterium]MDP7022539.1 RidA family protein [Candidatus Krumholzibacteria bacterium]
MKRQAISSDSAPLAIGPYSQAILSEGLLFTSGQIPLDPAKGKVVEGGIEEQSHQVMKNLGAILEAAGLAYGDLLKCTVFLSDMKNFQTFNEVYACYFEGGGPAPARSTVEVSALPLGVLIEIEAIARA